MRRECEVRGARVAVDDGSKPAAAGVRSAFRLGVMLSSMEARDMRRKSAGAGSKQMRTCMGITLYLTS
jgi:hypothetical protein